MRFNFLGLEIEVDQKLFNNNTDSMLDAKTKSTKAEPDQTNDKPITKRTLEFDRAWARGVFLQPEWDFSEIGRLETIDSYVSRSVKIKTSLATKEGFKFICKDPETIEYINKTYARMAVGTSIPTKLLVWKVLNDLLLYSNAYLVKSRDATKSIGRPYKIKGRETFVQPIAGYFPVHPSCMEISKNDKKVLQYKQIMPDGRYKIFSADDVVHFYYDRPAGFLTGKPTIVPVIEDIRLVRSLEENVAMLLHKHLFPLYHYTVGNDQHPAGNDQDGVREVERIQETLEELPADGVIITGHRHKIVAVGAESKAIRAEGYIEAAKKRALAGLAISTLDIGEGDSANRNTSDNLSKALINHVKDFQQNLEWQWDLFINHELLLQAPKSIDPLSDEYQVFLKFNEIDKDEMIKFEEHVASMWDHDLITWDEARNGLHKDPLTDEEKSDTRFYQIDLVELEAQVEMAKDSGDVTAGNTKKSNTIHKGSSSTTAKSTIKSTKQVAAKPASKRSANIVRPRNQYGTKTGPEKRKSSLDTEKFITFGDAVILDIEKLALSITDFIQDIEQLHIDNENYVCYNDEVIDDLIKQIHTKISRAIASGIKSKITYQLIVDFQIKHFLDSNQSS